MLTNLDSLDSCIAESLGSLNRSSRLNSSLFGKLPSAQKILDGPALP